MKNSFEKSKKFPIYQAGNNFYKPAHIIRNCDMHKLYEFFNPAENQVVIYGSGVEKDNPVPKLLEALGYDVTWEDDGGWKVSIPEEFRVKDVKVTETRRW